MVRPAPYRPGDLVRVVNPHVFVRCGYPMSLDDALAKIQDADVGKVEHLMAAFGFVNESLNWPNHIYRAHDQVIRALAYAYLAGHGFGGRERMIATKERLDIKDKVYKVVTKRTVKTGTYSPGYGDEDGGEPAYLRAEKTHIILSLVTHNPEAFDYDHFDIEAANVTRGEPATNP